MARQRPEPTLFDRELAELPLELRWRTWMERVEVVIFASAKPVLRETLARVVGEGCRLDELLADLREDLRGRPYELASVANGWQLRTRKGFADAIRASGAAPPPGPALSEYETLVLTVIAYMQPITRAELGRVLGREVSRDTIAGVRAAGFIAAGPRAPSPGAPATYVTTSAFLDAFSLQTLRDLPDLEAFEDAGLLSKAGPLDGELLEILVSDSGPADPASDTTEE